MDTLSVNQITGMKIIFRGWYLAARRAPLVSAVTYSDHSDAHVKDHVEYLYAELRDFYREAAVIGARIVKDDQ